MTTIVVVPSTVTPVAAAVPNLTVDVAVNASPVIVTDVPPAVEPVAGASPDTLGTIGTGGGAAVLAPAGAVFGATVAATLAVLDVADQLPSVYVSTNV